MGAISGPTQVKAFKPYWTWSVGSFEQVQHLICLFWGFLGVRRKAKARESLTAYHAFPLHYHRGLRKARVRLTVAAFEGIQQAVAAGRTYLDTAAAFGVSTNTVNRVIHGRMFATEGVL